jgi:Undecaprenyl-phosphate glucose phosphotransferase
MAGLPGFIERLREEPDAYRIVGIYDDRHTRVPSSQAGVDVLGSVQDLLDRLQQESVDVIVIALPLSATDRISVLLQKLGPSVADICLTTDLVGLRFMSGQIGDLGRNPVVSIREVPFKDWRAVQKAAMDYVLGSIALVLLSPILLTTAIMIKIDSKGPIIFRQPRLGFNNKLFVCYKFRSMQSDKTDFLADRQTTRDDPRITRVGRTIRKLSIDELPQIFNVLNGTMSLVGPRPHAPNTKAADRLFADVVQQYALRHRVKPGITGWAQANGWRGETSTSMQIEQRVAHDLFYIENWSIEFDFRIIALTIWNEIRSKHAF